MWMLLAPGNPVAPPMLPPPTPSPLAAASTAALQPTLSAAVQDPASCAMVQVMHDVDVLKETKIMGKGDQETLLQGVEAVAEAADRPTPQIPKTARSQSSSQSCRRCNHKCQFCPEHQMPADHPPRPKPAVLSMPLRRGEADVGESFQLGETAPP